MISQSDQEILIAKLGVFRIHGTHKAANPILLIFAKLFPGKLISANVVKKFLEDNVFPSLIGKKFSVVYVNSDAGTSRNFPGILALKSLYEAIPIQIQAELEHVYFLHPTFQSRLFLATIGRLIFSASLYGKLRWVPRLGYLWGDLRFKGFDMPPYVVRFDQQLESPPPLDLCLHIQDRPFIYGGPTLYYWPASTATLRSIVSYGFGP